MILQTATAEESAIMAFIDPMVLIYYILGIIIFIINAYRKPELRIFLLTFLSMAGSVLFMYLGNPTVEALCFFLAGIFSLVGVVYYRRVALKKTETTTQESSVRGGK